MKTTYTNTEHLVTLNSNGQLNSLTSL